MTETTSLVYEMVFNFVLPPLKGLRLVTFVLIMDYKKFKELGEESHLGSHDMIISLYDRYFVNDGGSCPILEPTVVVNLVAYFLVDKGGWILAC